MLSRRAVTATYDRTAARYRETFLDELDRKPFDRAELDAFADRVRGGLPVCDLGCGPGHVARYLHACAVPAFGVDLSRGMIVEARRAIPGLACGVGDMCDLPLPDASLGGLVAFYAIIHLPRADVGRALAEMARVLRPGAPVLLACHGGTGEIREDEFLGERTPIAATLFEPDEMRRLLLGAGFTDVRIRARAPYDFEYQTPRLYAWATAA